MKKALVILLIIALMAGAAGCGIAEEPEENGGKIRIVTTVFAAYDWTRNLIRGQEDSFDLVLLTDSGVDLHSFQPGVSDIAAITDCDLLIRTGGESEGFIEDIEEGGSFGGMEVNMLEILGTGAVMIDGEEGEEPDEHVWMSLRNAEEFCEAISDALKDLDPKNTGQYDSNLEAYLKELEELDGEFAELTGGYPLEVVVGDRNPFVYLFHDYGIGCHAAFSGCTSETSASFETVTELAKKADELGLRYIIVVDGSDGKVAQAIVNVTETHDQEIITLDSMQTVSAKDIEEGKTYISSMRADLGVLGKVAGKN